MQTTLTQKHLNIGFMWLWIKVIDKKHGQVNLIAHHFGGNLGISTHRTGIHALDIGIYSSLFESLCDKMTGSSGAYKMMMR